MRARIIPAAAVAALVALAGCADATLPADPDESRAGNIVEIRVQPSGVDDTEAIRAAIEQGAQSEVPAVVRLESGVYRTNFLVIRSFRGRIVGAGVGRTILQNVERLDFGTGVQPFEVDDPTYERPWPAFITITGGDVELADMTLRIDGPSPALPYDYLGATWDMVQYVVRVAGEHTSSSIARVRFEGEPGPLIGYNTFFGVYWAGNLDSADPLGVAGEHRLVGSSFDGVPFPVGSALENARLRIGGPGRDGNVIHNSLFGIFVNDAIDTDVRVINNRVTADLIGIRMWQGYFHEVHPEIAMPAPRGGRFTVSENDVTVGPGATAIFLRDAGVALTGTVSLAGSIERNRVVTAGACEPATCASIEGSGGRDIVVAGNTLRGAADAGIRIGFDTESSGWLLYGNHFDEFTGTPIHLGTESSRTRVSGHGDAAVLDEGTNNVVKTRSLAWVMESR